MTAAARDRFEKQGFVLVENVFDDAQMSKIEAALARHVAEVLPSQTGPWDGKNYTCEVAGDMSTVWRISNLDVDPFFAKLGSTVCSVWEAAFGLKAAGSCAGSQFFNKPPGGTKVTPPHQDGGYWLPRVANGCAELGNAVILLDDMNPENGGLHYVPGSHRSLRPHTDGVVGFSRALADWAADVDGAAEVGLVGRRGDVVVHHCLTVHRAGVNRTANANRRSLAWAFRSTNVEMREEAEDPNQGRVVGGELVKGDVYATRQRGVPEAGEAPKEET